MKTSGQTKTFDSSGRMVRLSSGFYANNAGWFICATLCYALFFQALYNLLKHNTLWAYSGVFDFIESFLKNYIPILLLSLLNTAIVFQMPLPRKVESNQFAKTLADIAVSFIGLFIVNGIYLLICKLFSIPSGVHVAGTILSDLLILLFVEIAYYICLSQEHNRTATEQKKKAIEYRYDALKSQINPHFLFNSLNVLYSLIDIDKEKSKEFVRSLTEVYRLVLSFRNRTTVSLEEELELLNAFVEVLATRYHNQFFVKIENHVSPGATKSLIPFSLQLLIENVTKHNEVSSLNPMRVTVKVENEYITVTNPICPKRVSTSSGMGLAYIRQQYSRFGKALKVEGSPDEFSVSLPFV